MTRPPGEDPEERKKAAQGRPDAFVISEVRLRAALRDAERKLSPQDLEHAKKQLSDEEKGWEKGKADNIESSSADARIGAVVQAILASIGAIGIVLCTVSYSMHLSAEGKELGSAEEVVAGLGIELTGSAAMIAFFFFVLRGSCHKLKLILGSAAVGILSVGLSLFLDKSWWRGSVGSFGIEIVGAVVVFCVFDNVIEALKRNDIAAPR